MTLLELGLTVLCGVLSIWIIASSRKKASRKNILEKNYTERISNDHTSLLNLTPTRKKSVVFRVRGLFSHADLPAVLQTCLGVDCKFLVKSFAPQADENVNIATVTFDTTPVQLLGSDQKTFGEENVTFDTHFRGLSVLSSPEADQHHLDIIAICGLGGHAFGSFKERNGTYMWLRDSVPQDFVNARVLIYGYDSQIHGSTSFQTIESLASSLRNHIEGIKSPSGTLYEKPIIFIAHSLGGLALIQSVKAKSQLSRCTRGALFFGVPNQGMHISSLIPMAIGQPNEALLHNLQQESELLRSQSRDFPAIFVSKEARIFCFYETQTSPKAVKGTDGKWKMDGEHVTFVGSASATHCRHWESEAHHVLGLNRDHSGLVKFKSGDQDYIKIRNVLRGIINDQYKFPQPGPMISEEEQKLTKKCLKEMGHTNPIDTKRRIETTKDDLVERCNEWIKSDPRLGEWKNDPQQRLLWLNGDPGKGKTMLMMSLVNELKITNSGHQTPITFFFCQSTDTRLNTARAVLRGLLWLLIHKNPILGRHLHEDYKHQKEFLRGPDAFVALCRVMTEVLQDVTLSTVYILIDALDECNEERGELLRFIGENSTSATSKARWLVSSRNDPYIEKELNMYQHGVLSLELNATHISAAVEWFIHRKVDDLAKRNYYSDNLRDRVQRHMMHNSNSTFLWVALACKHLSDTAKRNVPAELAKLPAGLSSLYDQMLKQLRAGQDHELAMAVIKFVTIAKRPLLTEELIPLLAQEESQNSDEHFEDEFDNDDLLDLIKSCGSFITVREGVIYLIHQSVKDYLVKDDKRIFSPFMSEEHCTVVDRSLAVLSRELMKNIYAHDYPRYPERGARQSLVNFGYVSCLWVEHLAEYQKACAFYLQEDLSRYDEKVYDFMSRHFLHWTELLSLLGQLKIGLAALRGLEAVAKQCDSEKFYLLMHDSVRFLMHCYPAIEKDPSQIYNFGLTFAPQESLVRKTFLGQIPSWVSISPYGGKGWSQRQQTLVVNDGFVLIAFSPDSRQLASASDYTIKLWDTLTGTIMMTLKGHDRIIESILYSPDGRQLATTSNDNTVKLWDVLTGRKLWMLRGHTSRVSKAVFSPNGKLLVSISDDHTMRLWDTATGKHVRTFSGHTGPVTAVEFGFGGGSLVTGSGDKTVRSWNIETKEASCVLYSHNSFVRATIISPVIQQIASASTDGNIGLWNNSTHTLSWLLGHTRSVGHIVFSPNGRQLASSSEDSTTRLWDIATRRCLHIFRHTHDPGYRIRPAAFSPDSQQLAISFGRNNVHLRNPTTNDPLQKFHHDEWVKSLLFSPDGRQLAIQLNYKTIELWDVLESSEVPVPEYHAGVVVPKVFGVSSLIFSPDGQHVVSVSKDHKVRVWSATTGEPLLTGGHGGIVRSVTFSSDCQRMASSSDDLTIRVWDTATGHIIRRIRHSAAKFYVFAISPNFRLLAFVESESDDQEIHTWNIATDEIRSIGLHDDKVSSLVFSPDGEYLASGSRDGRLQVWATTSHKRVTLLNGHTGPVETLIFRPDGKQLASGANGEILLWNTETWQIVQRFVRHNGWGISIAFSSDGQKLAFNIRNAEIQLGNLVDEVYETIEFHGVRGNKLSFSPDGQQLAVSWSAEHSHEGQAQLWDITSGKVSQMLESDAFRSGPVIFSPDGRYMAWASSGGTIWLRETKQSGVLHKLKTLICNITALAFSPDGRYLASGSANGMIYLWNTKTGQIFETLMRHRRGVGLLAFSLDGKQLVSGSLEPSAEDSQTVNLWNPETGKILWETSHRVLPVTSVALSADGRQLASASNDTIIRLWDMSTGKLLQMIGENTDVFCSVALSPNGQKLVSASSNGTIQLWDTLTGTILQKHSCTASSVASVAFRPDGQTVVSRSGYRTVCLWNPESNNSARMYDNKSASQIWHIAVNGDDRAERGFSFNESSNWLRFNDYQLIWLQPDFRPSVSAVHGNRIAWGCASGKVYTLEVDPDQLHTTGLV